jgi:hypothetical protein
VAGSEAPQSIRGMGGRRQGAFGTGHY